LSEFFTLNHLIDFSGTQEFFVNYGRNVGRCKYFRAAEIRMPQVHF